MAQKMKVVYLDGSEVEVIASPRAQVMTERFLKGYSEVTMVEAGYRLAYESSKPGIGNVGYEEWLDKIADVEELCPKCGATLTEQVKHDCPGADPTADPTPEGQSPTSSSD